MTYALGQIIEVCMDFDLPLAQGVRHVVATFENERGEVVELTDMPLGTSECFLQKPRQTALQGRAANPGSYELKSLRIEHLSGVTYVEPPHIYFEVRARPQVVGWRLG